MEELKKEIPYSEASMSFRSKCVHNHELLKLYGDFFALLGYNFTLS